MQNPPIRIQNTPFEMAVLRGGGFIEPYRRRRSSKSLSSPRMAQLHQTNRDSKCRLITFQSVQLNKAGIRPRTVPGRIPSELGTEVQI